MAKRKSTARRDLTGRQYTRLTVLELLPRDDSRAARYWLCQCACGKEVRVTTGNLNSGAVRSCGCLKRKLSDEERKRNRKESFRQYAQRKADFLATRQATYQETRRRKYHEDEAVREDMKRRSRAYVAANKERCREVRREYLRRHPEVKMAALRRRWARKRGAKDTRLTLAQWRGLLDAYGHCCAYCGIGGVKLEQDHVVPLSKGGQHVKENVVPACRSCNARKHTQVWEPREPRGDIAASDGSKAAANSPPASGD